jgi:chromosome segregation protein
VIFNGSGGRKPISRASVELVFDNSFGGAGGEWSQYAEISVKRVIERDKGSTYYINNSVVRRRDVADLFLGTGLGGRAYAIIGQNTISRIVEAKPEEMRIFLEEAAGISKYKERRRETELRLRDTRENLTRVEDVLRELDKQIARLQSQAVVAEQYHRLQESLQITKAQVWLLKKRDASAAWEKAQRAVEKVVNELEAQMALLRHSESDLEHARQTHFSATEALNAAQAAYYEANAEVSNLENQVRNTAEARERMQIQVQQLQSQLEKNAALHLSHEASLKTAQKSLILAVQEISHSEQQLTEAKANLPQQSAAYQTALNAFNASQAAFMNAEQRLNVEQANLAHIGRASMEAAEHIKRLEQNLNGLQAIDEALLLEKQSQLAELEQQIQALELKVSASIKDEQALHQALKDAREAAVHHQRNLASHEAEVGSLIKLQRSIQNDGAANLAAWLGQNGFTQEARIWQLVTIVPGWETAVEAVLGARLNAIVNDVSLSSSRPPSALTLASKGQALHKSSARSLLSKVEHISPDYEGAVHDWLAHVYWLEEGADIALEREDLQAWECLVNQHGDIYTKHTVSYFGAQSAMHGVLERQAQLKDLQRELPALEELLKKSQEAVSSLESQLQAARNAQQTHSQAMKNLTGQMHQHQLALQQLKQQQANVLLRQKSFIADIEAGQQKQAKLNDEKKLKEAIIDDIAHQLTRLREEKTTLGTSRQQMEASFNGAREALQVVERTHQEKLFNKKLIDNNINDLNLKLNHLLEETAVLKIRSTEVENMLAATKMDALRSNLEAALNKKQMQETLLAAARDHLSESETSLQQQERTRMQNEQMLHPLRDQLETGRLSEQQTRLYFEQCQAELDAAGHSEIELNKFLEALTKESSEPVKVSSLERKTFKLEQDISALGAVNLAAIQELDTEQTRKTYLDSQCHDLQEASTTLEDAIRKIDRETRGRLQATYDEANRHFNELFVTLFGGGQARLELLGEEILDTGIQVFAQPPGKKNSTIHLLSGGEKALTALALVFALFRLNPAPFCLMDEVDAPLDDSNTERFCAMVKKMSEKTQFLYVSHNKITMEMAQQLIGVTMQESGVSRIVDVDMEAAVRMVEEVSA